MIGFYFILGINFIAIYGPPIKKLAIKFWKKYSDRIKDLLGLIQKEEEVNDDESSSSEEADPIDKIVRLKN